MSNSTIHPKEVAVPENYRIVSRTDLRGTILEANSEFIEISGYTEAELIGQPHNILRHPDVPPAVFKDFWETLQSGKGWTQFVKNRCKNGDYYWVKANAGPIIENGKTVGYLSVRNSITDEEKKVAEQAYRDIAAGKIKIQEGRLYSPFEYFWNNLGFNHWSIMTKTVVMASFLVILGTFITSILAGIGYQKAVDQNYSLTQKNMETALDVQIESRTESALNNAINIAQHPQIREELQAGQGNSRTKLVLDNLNDRFKAGANHGIKVHVHTHDGRSFLRSWKPKKNGDDITSFRFTVNHAISKQTTVKALELGRAGVAIRGVSPIFSLTGNEYVGSVEVIESLADLAKQLNKDGIHYFSILNDYAVSISTKAKNNPKLGEFFLGSKNYAPEDVALLEQLDLQALIEQGALRSDKRFFVAKPILDLQEKLVGYHIVAVENDVVDALNMTAKESATQTVIEVVVAMILLTLFFMLILYFSVAKRISAIRDIMRFSEQNGDLSLRADSTFKDEMGQLAGSFNAQMQTTQMVIAEANRMVSDIANGKLDTTTVIPMNKDFNVIKLNMNGAAKSMQETFSEIDSALAKVQQGDFTVAENTPLKGDYKQAIVKTNLVITTLQDLFAEVNKVLEKVAHGHFKERFENLAHGEYGTLQDNVNRSLTNLEAIISETAEVMIKQGGGDLTHRISQEIDGTLLVLKEGVNNASANMAGLMAQSNYSVEKLANGTQVISQEINSLAERTREQSAAIEQTAANMEEVTSAIESTAENSTEASKVAQESITRAENANSVVLQTIDAIEKISDSSSRISEITALIDSIAFQTNLLALNAAVEAARAGEHGRGFAVVAGEVRNLAQKSADAAKEINQLIGETLSKVKHGADMADRSGDALTMINESISQIANFVSEISTNAQEQALGAGNINQALSKIDQMNMSNSDLVEKTVEEIESMRTISDDVIETMKGFTIDYEQISCTQAMKSGVFEFAHAIQAHRSWKGKVHGYINGMDMDFNEEAAIDHHKCALGLWFYGPEGQRYAHLSSMRDLEVVHAELHECIRQILEAHKIGDQEMVDDKLHQLDDYSEAVIEALLLVERDVIQSQY